MHLSSLTLTNVRQFEQRTFDFQPGFNLLVGENGAGKTTILRGILAVLGGVQQLGRRPRMEDDDIRLLARRAEVSAMIRSDDNKVEEFHFRKELWEPARRSARRTDLPLILLYASNEATCSAMRVKRTSRARDFKSDPFRHSEEFLYELERERSQRSVFANERPFGSSRSVRDFVGRMLSTFASDMSTFYWRFEPYDCSLLLPEGQAKQSQLDVETQRQARAFAMRKFQEGSLRRRNRPFNWPDQAKVVLTRESPEPGRDKDLPDLNEIWEGMRISPETRELLLSCSLEVKLTPRITIQGRMGPLSLSQLSDGEQRLFTLFVDVARQLSIRNHSDEFGGGEAIVLIDEIDVHLHPKWQRRIVPALEDLFPNCQFIATTHSPFVIQATSRQRITAIDPEVQAVFLEGGNSIEDIAEDIQGVPVPQRSARAERLSDAAKRYFTLLKRRETHAQQVSAADLSAAERSYREASEPFTSDPAVHALLKVQMMEANGP